MTDGHKYKPYLPGMQEITNADAALMHTQSKTQKESQKKCEVDAKTE